MHQAAKPDLRLSFRGFHPRHPDHAAFEKVWLAGAAPLKDTFCQESVAWFSSAKPGISKLQRIISRPTAS
jgi:hypothetical protein